MPIVEEKRNIVPASVVKVKNTMNWGCRNGKSRKKGVAFPFLDGFSARCNIDIEKILSLFRPNNDGRVGVV